jgi:hypothetical protein
LTPCFFTASTTVSGATGSTIAASFVASSTICWQKETVRWTSCYLRKQMGPNYNAITYTTEHNIMQRHVGNQTWLLVWLWAHCL